MEWKMERKCVGLGQEGGKLKKRNRLRLQNNLRNDSGE